MEDKIDWVVFDAEADGFKPSKFHCLSFEDHKGDRGTLTDYVEIQEFFRRYDYYVGHNIRRWDLPNLQRVVGIGIPEGIIDTLGLVWYLDPERARANLEGFGDDFGIEKPRVLDWENLRLADYVDRCEQDVKINTRLWTGQLEKLHKLYPDKDDLVNFLKYLDFKLYSASLAEESKWRLDEERCRTSLARLTDERDAKTTRLAEVLPKVPVIRSHVKPKRFRNADGQLSLLGQRWQDRLVSQGLPPEYDGVVDEIVGENPGNPGSSVQIKSWLNSLGWIPRTIKHVRDKKTGEVKDIPQINKEHGGGICDSIKELYEKEPNLELLDGLSVLNHRIALLSGFLRDGRDGFLQASVAGLTNTLRFKHAEIVNLPKPEKPYGNDIRGCLVARHGYELCGSDMASLEDRIKQHFIYFHDPDYVDELNRPDYDPHLDIAVLAGGLKKSSADLYKRLDAKKDKTDGEKKEYGKIKKIRSIFKNGNYACQYGAGIPRLEITCGIDRKAAARLHKAYWDRNWAIKAVAEEQTIKDIDGQMWLYNPVSGFWYSLRYEKDIFSTLVQGTAAFVFDLYLKRVLSRRPQVTGQFHDEFILEVKKGHREEVEVFLTECIEEVNDLLRLNRSLGIGIQFGDNYAEIH